MIISILSFLFGLFLFKQKYKVFNVNNYSEKVTKQEVKQFFHIDVDVNIVCSIFLFLGLYFCQGFYKNKKYYYKMFIIINIIAFFLFYFKKYTIYKVGEKVSFNWPTCKPFCLNDSLDKQEIKYQMEDWCQNAYDAQCGCDIPGIEDWSKEDKETFIQRVEKYQFMINKDEYKTDTEKNQQFNEFQRNEFSYLFIFEKIIAQKNVLIHKINEKIKAILYITFNSFFECDGRIYYYTEHLASSQMKSRVLFLEKNFDNIEITIKFFQAIQNNITVFLLLSIISAFITCYNFDSQDVDMEMINQKSKQISQRKQNTLISRSWNNIMNLIFKKMNSLMNFQGMIKISCVFQQLLKISAILCRILYYIFRFLIVIVEFIFIVNIGEVVLSGVLGEYYHLL